MKKILLATTVLAMTAGVAAAEVAVSGSARMGVVNDGTDTMFSSRIRIAFAATGTTDGGLSFGANVRNDQSGVGNTANGDSTVFISGSFGTLTMGDVAGGASDNLVGQVSGVGYEDNVLASYNEIGFLGGTATAARYDYTSGPLSVSVGIGQPSAADKAKSIAVKYAPGSYSVALGYSKTDTDSQIDLLGSATFGAATVKAKVADRDSAADLAYAVSLDYVAGAATITAYHSQNIDFAGFDSSGLGVSYDLGGGAAVKAGVVDANGTTVYDAGVTMSF